MDHTSINQIIVDIMVVFMLIGAADKCLGNRYKLGERFDEGIRAMGPLSLSMIGIVCIAPVLGKVLTPVVGPVYSFLGADPGMFAGTLLANDMGGYPLALEMAKSQEAAEFSGILLGSMLGVNIVFSIPVSLGIINKEDIPAFATGMLCGIVSVPVGCFVGGLLAGYDLLMIMRNLVPILLVALLVALGLWKAPSGMIKGFSILGKVIIVLATASFAFAIVERLTGIVIIPGMEPVDSGIASVGHIAIVLAGAFPLVSFVTRVFQKPLLKAGALIGVNETAAAGLIASLANNVPMFCMIKDMDERGIVVNVAFSACASAIIGDHLGYTAASAPHMIAPMLAGKLTGGIVGLLLALYVCKIRAKKAKAVAA